MPGERFDYSSERQRHEKFVGRAGLLAQLDQLLVNSETDRWVVRGHGTPDGWRVVSASDDGTLMVWDLETYACLLTHRGDAPYSAVATSATVIVAGDSAGGVWFLDWLP